MAVAVDWDTKVITVPRADLTFDSGTLYTLDTDWLRLQLKALEDDEEGILHPDTHRHNTEVTVAGVTYAQFIEIINGYQVRFDPDDEPYTILLTGSNNNLFEQGVLIPGNYSIISQNSAGLVVTSGGGSAPTPQQVADAVWDESLTLHDIPGSAGESLAQAPLDQPVEAGTSMREALRLLLASQVGKLSGAEGTEIRIRDINDLVDRIVATVDESGNRLSVTTDAS